MLNYINFPPHRIFFFCKLKLSLQTDSQVDLQTRGLADS